MCIYSFFNHRQVQDIDTEHKVLVNEVKKQKLRIYQISQYLPKSAWDIIEGKRKAKIQRKPISIFFSDIVGFSNLSEELEAEVLSNVLSSYLAEMSNVVTQFNGTIDKFVGDAIMITFGDDSAISISVKQDATACVSMAIAMGKRMHELQHTWSEMGINKPLQIRMGINTGYCTVGTFGTSRHLDHTALGVHVNLASRLESAAQAEEILISHETWSLVKDSVLCKDRGQIKAKGFTHPIQVYQGVDHRKEMGADHCYFSQTADGFSMHLDVEKVKNYDREKVIASLDAAATKLKE
jgi:class 3 adenylate cyclase